MNYREIIRTMPLLLLAFVHSGNAQATFAPSASDQSPQLTARGGFAASKARVGDTVEYNLRVEWSEGAATLMVLPPSSGELHTPGFTVIGQSAVHRKTSVGGTVRSLSEFTYLLVAREEGVGRVMPYGLGYRHSQSGEGRIETHWVDGSTLEIRPAPIAWGLWLALFLGGALILSLIGSLLINRKWKPGRSTGLATLRRANTPSPGHGIAPNEFTRAIAGLRDRCEAADSRCWLQDAEKVCVAWLCRNLGVTKPQEVRFEAALEQYLARHPSRDPGYAASWTKLRDLFHEARYASGRREPFELRDACRLMNICMTPGDPSPVKLENR